ncbi:MAG: hypothetical protein U0269_16245 [Polyangiales bacterium]
MLSGRSLAALAPCALLAACEPEPPVPGRVEHKGVYGTLVAPAHVSVSDAALAHADALIVVASQALSVEPGRHRVLVFPPQRSGQALDDCPIPRDYRRRCLPPNRVVIVTHTLDDNNLIRGVLWRSHHGHEAFATALARALGDPSSDVALWDGGWSAVADAQAAPTEAEWPLFLQWIVRERGVGRALEWYRSTRPGQRTEDVLASFEIHTQRSFSSELARFRERGPRALQWGAWSIAAMCRGGDSLTLGERIAPVLRHAYEDSPPSAQVRYSTASGGDQRWTSRDAVTESIHRFTVREPRALSLTAVHADESTTDPTHELARPDATYSIVSCDRGEGEGGGSGRNDVIAELPAGRYAVRTRVQQPRRFVEVMVSQQTAGYAGPVFRRALRWEPPRPAFGRPTSAFDASVWARSWSSDSSVVALDLAPVEPSWFISADRELAQTVQMRTDRWRGDDRWRHFVIVAPSSYSWGERAELRVDQWNPAWGPLTARTCIERDRRVVCEDQPVTERPIVLNGLVILRAPPVPTPVSLQLTGAVAALYSNAY